MRDLLRHRNGESVAVLEALIDALPQYLVSIYPLNRLLHNVLDHHELEIAEFVGERFLEPGHKRLDELASERSPSGLS